MPSNHQLHARAARSQRWRDRREQFVDDSTVIDPRELAVDVIRFSTAKAFIEANHYAGSMPATRLSVGLFRNAGAGRSRLVGVAAFSVPINNASVPLHTGLQDPRAAADLGRFCLLDEVAANGETWMLSRALRLLRQTKPEIQAVMSYSDPLPRWDPQTGIYKRGHVGRAYAAWGGSSSRLLAYRGRSQRRREYLTPDGQTFSSRAISKVRSGETGQRYAIDELIRRGAPPPSAAEEPAAWFAHLLRLGFFTVRTHPGTHVYCFSLTRKAKLAGRTLPSLPLPLLDPDALDADRTALPLFAAAARRCAAGPPAKGQGEGTRV